MSAFFSNRSSGTVPNDPLEVSTGPTDALSLDWPPGVHDSPDEHLQIGFPEATFASSKILLQDPVAAVTPFIVLPSRLYSRKMNTNVNTKLRTSEIGIDHQTPYSPKRQRKRKRSGKRKGTNSAGSSSER